MKYLLIIFIIVSCSQKSNKLKDNYLAGMQFRLDTVIVNPGDEIIFLNQDIQSASLSNDKKYLYNFNPNDHTFEKVNLDALQLEEKISFEKEGPNGTGDFFGGLRILNSNEFTISTINWLALFSLDGTRIKKINYEGFFLENNPIRSGTLSFISTYLDSDASRFFALLGQEMDKLYSLGVFNLDDYSYRKIPIPSFDGIYDYKFNLQFGPSSISFGPKLSMVLSESRLIFSNQLLNELSIYDMQGDSMYVKEYSSHLTENKKVNKYQQDHESEEILVEEFTRFHQEINFLPPFWDEKNQVFYRFSFQELPANSENGVLARSDIYLSVLDKDLNLIGEALVPDLRKKPATLFSNLFPRHFAKDGKIWIYENINDEMGFVILSITNQY
ncbi:DUF4221 domain-containing protein [Belliella sp. R4-6]|uniref:DUF4221 domain-containing protein n=1 Tax=Belliella alkalica TaxID=1730871 RepID=A0ABS9V8T4_9BACT|nr:DUF4221 family protein [Belliella alkalica]MCH7412837.1 DUF4221 domain-containing protein [Belliella alkalica]